MYQRVKRMLPGLAVAGVGIGMQAQAVPPPPATLPLLVHGYVYFDAGSAVPIRPCGSSFAPNARYS